MHANVSHLEDNRYYIEDDNPFQLRNFNGISCSVSSASVTSLDSVRLLAPKSKLH